MALRRIFVASWFLPFFCFGFLASRKFGELSKGRFRNEVNLIRVKSHSIEMVAPIANIFRYLKSNDNYVWSILLASSTIGLFAEKTKIGAMISSPLITTCLTLLFCNIGILPINSRCYDSVFKIFVPIAIPLLLFEADLKKCLKDTGTLIKAFLIGSLGTVLGSIIAYALVPMRSLPAAPTICAALCARHIGGAVNFVAVADALGTPAEVVAAALAADNVAVALYFSYLFTVSASEDSEIRTLEALDTSVKTPVETESIRNETIDAKSISAALFLALLINTLSQPISTALHTSPIIVISGLSVLIATLVPGLTTSLAPSASIIGVLLMQMFFAVTGALGHIPTVIRVAPSLALHTTVQIVVHYVTAVTLGRFLKLPFREIVLASNANVGGPTTAAAMASSKGWRSLVLPALLVGVFGYAIATFIGVGLGNFLLSQGSKIGKFGLI